MRLVDAEKRVTEAISNLANALNPLGQEWKVAFNTSRKTVASFNDADKTFRFSRAFLEIATPDEIQRVIAHEMAHALVGAEHGHTKKWKSASALLGGDGSLDVPLLPGLLMGRVFGLGPYGLGVYGGVGAAVKGPGVVAVGKVTWKIGEPYPLEVVCEFDADESGFAALVELIESGLVGLRAARMALT